MEFIPFGPNCTPADILKVGGFRKYSLPFDWLFAFPENIKKSLDADFSDWFDTSLMTVLRDDPHVHSRTWTRHKNYELSWIGTAGFFNHHDMTDPDTQSMFRRRIERFRNIIASKEHIVFVTLIKPEEMSNHGLSNYFNRPGKITFLYLEHVISDDYRVEPSMSSGIIKITYWSPVQFDHQVGMLVSDSIRRIFDPHED